MTQTSNKVLLGLALIVALISATSALTLTLCFSGDLIGCCSSSLLWDGAACDIGGYSVGLLNQTGCGNPGIKLNFFYVTDANHDYWGGCLSAIPPEPLNCSTVIGFEGYYVMVMGKTDKKFYLTVTVQDD